jgi:hypothetical protein
MFTKIAVRSFSVLAFVVFGLFSGVAFAAPGGPACPLVSASIARQECLASGASAVLPAQEQVVVSSQAVAYSAAETAQEEVVLRDPAIFAWLSSRAAATPAADMSVQEETVLSAVDGNSVTFASLASQPATITAVDHTVQEEVVLSAATGNPGAFALLASRAAADSAALTAQDVAVRDATTASAAQEYQPNDRSFHTPQTSDYRPADQSFHTPQTSDYRP